MAQGRLRVTVVEAAKLADKDKTDFNDPYVEIYIDAKKKQKTGTINNTERPVWNETFELYVMISRCFLILMFFFNTVNYGRIMTMSISMFTMRMKAKNQT